MNGEVFVLIIGIICIIALVMTGNEVEGIGALKSPHMTGFGAWPQNLYGSSEKTDTTTQYNSDLSEFMRHSDGYDEKLWTPVSADWSFTV